MGNIVISISFAWLIVFPFFIISLVRAKSPQRREAALNEAIKKGHVVTAVLKKTYADVDDPYSRSARDMVDLGVYEYVYKGKTYKYKRYDDYLPSTLRLYFLRSPRKAVEGGALSSTRRRWFPIVAVIACVIYCIFHFNT